MIPLLVGCGLLVTLTEIVEQHYYRARFAHKRVYIPLLLTPPAIVASFARAFCPTERTGRVVRNPCAAAATFGLVGTSFH